MDILRAATPAAWTETALADFDAVLSDHAHCEKKAAATAMALVSAYPELTLLVDSMTRLAQEELRHFQRVHQLIVGRGGRLGRDHGDPYAQGLVKLVRGTPDERRTDRLLVAALIEARSAERLELLGAALADAELADFYRGLAKAEAGHYRLFVRLAERYAEPRAVQVRLAELAAREAALMLSLPLAARIH